MKLTYHVIATDKETSRDGILSLAGKVGYLALLYRLYEMAEPKEETTREWMKRKGVPGFFGDARNTSREHLRERLKKAEANFHALAEQGSELRRRLKPEHGERYILTPEWSEHESKAEPALKELESARRALNAA
jgi:hypothetical protein